MSEPKHNDNLNKVRNEHLGWNEEAEAVLRTGQWRLLDAWEKLHEKKPQDITSEDWELVNKIERVEEGKKNIGKKLWRSVSGVFGGGKAKP